MDIKEITKSLLTTANVKDISGKSGATAAQVKKVLTSALPSVLGGQQTSAEEISKETGVSKAKTNGILSAAGPLLSGLLGGGSSSQSESSSSSGTAALLGSLLGSVNISSLASGLINLVSADKDEEEEKEEEKPKPSGKKKTGKKTEGKKTEGKKTEGKKTSGKKTSGKKTTAKKEEKKDSSPLSSVTDLLGGLFK